MARLANKDVLVASVGCDPDARHPQGKQVRRRPVGGDVGIRQRELGRFPALVQHATRLPSPLPRRLDREAESDACGTLPRW